MNKVVSFCISAYKRKDMVLELVNHLLQVQRDDFEVVVVDDCSKDGTIEALSQIRDSRLRFKEHEQNKGCNETWFDSIDFGEGEWLFHVIDRDWIQTEYLGRLIDTLNELKHQNVGFAVAGERIDNEQNYTILQKGYDTINEFALRDSHPTGQIFRRDLWLALEARRNYFVEEQYGLYPHGFIYALIGNFFSGAFIHFDICDKIHHAERTALASNSNIYKKKSDIGNEWFMPQSRQKLLYIAMDNLDLIDNKECIPYFVINKYVRFFSAVTYQFYGYCNNETVKRRYNCEDLTTNYLSVLANGFDYSLAFRAYLEEEKPYWADQTFYSNFNRLDKQLISQLIDWTNNFTGEK